MEVNLIDWLIVNTSLGLSETREDLYRRCFTDS